MKQGKTLEALGAELQRQRAARQDFVADTRKLSFFTEGNKSKLTFTTGEKLLEFGVNPLAHQQISARLGIPLKYYQRMQDFANACVFVKRSLAHVVGKGAVFQEPKTKGSRRRVLLLLEDIAALQEYRQWQWKYANELGDKFVWHNLLFTSPFGSPISPTNFNRRYFKPLLKQCRIGEGFTFHGLRHTHATLLLQQGVNPKIVQERLGHSSIKVTMDVYSHVLPDMQKQAVDALRELFP